MNVLSVAWVGTAVQHLRPLFHVKQRLPASVAAAGIAAALMPHGGRSRVLLLRPLTASVRTNRRTGAPRSATLAAPRLGPNGQGQRQQPEMAGWTRPPQPQPQSGGRFRMRTKTMTGLGWPRDTPWCDASPRKMLACRFRNRNLHHIVNHLSKCTVGCHRSRDLIPEAGHSRALAPL